MIFHRDRNRLHVFSEQGQIWQSPTLTIHLILKSLPAMLKNYPLQIFSNILIMSVNVIKKYMKQKLEIQIFIMTYAQISIYFIWLAAKSWSQFIVTEKKRGQHWTKLMFHSLFNIVLITPNIS